MLTKTFKFLIKGVYYSPKQQTTDGTPPHRRPRLDPLTDHWLDDLHRDIPLIHELGLNTLSVSHLDPSQSHHRALSTLCNAGLYVIVDLLDSLTAPPPSARHRHDPQHPLPANPTPSPPSDQFPEPNFDTQSAYALDLLTETFTLVDELARYPNVLAFVVSADSTNPVANSKMAEVVRAAVRDVRGFLRRRGRRRVPVGVSNAELLMQRGLALGYFTAGTGLTARKGGAAATDGVGEGGRAEGKDEDDDEDDGRVDFFAPSSWSWANRSSFQISGWKNMVARLGEVPVPMFLHKFGTYVGTPRIWGEVGCLYSKDMTGVFSGGIVYQFFEDGSGYGLVEIVERGMRKKKRRDFRALRENMRLVNGRGSDQVYDGNVKEYENWVGSYPETVASQPKWYATAKLPDFPGSWDRWLQ